MFGSNSIITGGILTQVNNYVQQRTKTPWDRLESAVAPAAFHNSAERCDPPRCYPNTRLAVMAELRDMALQRGNASKTPILWLSGPAGAGKSAIAQSFCEECFSRNLLLASFFFNRSDPSRNTAKFFVGTLAYQIYGKVPAYYQSLILDAVENDPLVFERSIDAQFKTLIMDPLQDLFVTKHFDQGAPCVIVVDGLDECATGALQVSILNALGIICKLPQPPFVFIIASRPEHNIHMFFRAFTLTQSIQRLNLDNSYHPDADIELFLRERIRETCATHPLKDSILREWPSDEDIQAIVQKSSGQFIYASVSIKYVTSGRHYPPNRLDVVLQLRPPKRDLPFAELDALYTHILSHVEDITIVLRIFHIVILFHDVHLDISTQDIERLCDLDQGECHGALCDLHSVLDVDSTIHLLHNSLPDYLRDFARSNIYHIDTTPRTVIPIVMQCLQHISDPKLDYNPRYAGFVSHHFSLLLSNIELFHRCLMSFSLISCQQTFHENASNFYEPWLISQFLWFAFMFLDHLRALEGTEHEHIYHHLLHQFPKLVNQYPQVYGPNVPPENQDCIFPMLAIFILLGKSNSHIAPEVFELLEILPFNVLSQHPLKELPREGFEHLPCSAALSCINSLMHDSSPKPAAFALKFLPIILPASRLSPDLNVACRPGAPFAYAATGDHELSVLAHNAYTAMQQYRERYATEY